MLQTIHDKLKGIFAVAILVALGIVFVFWGVNFTTDAGGLTRAKGIEVNGREIEVADVQRNYQEEMSRVHTMMGEAGVPDELQKSIRQRVIDMAVRTELLRQRTEKLRFQASDAEVLEAIREVPAFQVEGRFSTDAYLAALQSIGISARALRSRAAPVPARAPGGPRTLCLRVRAAVRARPLRRAARRSPHDRMGPDSCVRLRVRRRARRRCAAGNSTRRTSPGT